MKQVVRLYKSIADLLEESVKKERLIVDTKLATACAKISLERKKLADGVTLRWSDKICSRLIKWILSKGSHEADDYLCAKRFLSDAFCDLCQIRHDKLAMTVWWELHALLWEDRFSRYEEHFIHYERILEGPHGSGSVLIHTNDVSCLKHRLLDGWVVSGVGKRSVD